MMNYSGDSQLGMPPGFRFHPTDEELVMHYLIRKCASQTISVPIIADVDLYKFDPWQLPEMALYGEKEWYFFSPRDRKYPNGSRPNRAAGAGYWKATGADKAIGKPKAVGIKKALVFYAGRSPHGVKTNWIMHEYRLANVDRSAGKKTGKDNLRLDDWVLCRIYNKKGKVEKYNVASQEKLSEIPEYEDTKPKLGSKPTTVPPQAPPSHIEDTSMVDELFRFESNDSVPSQLLTNSSGSWHGDSSDVTYEKEVQSRPKENDFGNGLGFDQFDYFGAFSNDPFEPQMQQFQPGEFYLDMFM